MGKAAALGDAEGDPVSKVKAGAASGVFPGVVATTRVDWVKNENSGLIVCAGCFIPAAGEVVEVPVLPLDGKVIAGSDEVPVEEALLLGIDASEGLAGMGWQLESKIPFMRPQPLGEVGVGVDVGS